MVKVGCFFEHECNFSFSHCLLESLLNISSWASVVEISKKPKLHIYLIMLTKHMSKTSYKLGGQEFTYPECDSGSNIQMFYLDCGQWYQVATIQIKHPPHILNFKMSEFLNQIHWQDCANVSQARTLSIFQARVFHLCIFTVGSQEILI